MLTDDRACALSADSPVVSAAVGGTLPAGVDVAVERGLITRRAGRPETDSLLARSRMIRRTPTLRGMAGAVAALLRHRLTDLALLPVAAEHAAAEHDEAVDRQRYAPTD